METLGAREKALLLLAALLSGLLGHVATASADADVSSGTYHLFSPVPSNALRPLSVGETPYTVDAGHLQLETAVAVLVLDDPSAAGTTHAYAAPMNLTLGLTTFADLQLILEPHHMMTVDDQDAAPGARGYGATSVRLKLNVYGNDDGASALAVVPYLTHADGATQSGVAVIFGAALPGELGLLAVLASDLGALASGASGAEVLAAANLTHVLSGPLCGTIELATAVPTNEPAAATLTVNGALSLAFADEIQLDLGTHVGVVGAPGELELFLALSARR